MFVYGNYCLQFNMSKMTNKTAMHEVNFNYIFNLKTIAQKKRSFVQMCAKSAL